MKKFLINFNIKILYYRYVILPTAENAYHSLFNLIINCYSASPRHTAIKITYENLFIEHLDAVAIKFTILLKTTFLFLEGEISIKYIG